MPISKSSPKEEVEAYLAHAEKLLSEGVTSSWPESRC